MGDVVSITSHPNWGKRIPKDDDPLVVKNLNKLGVIKGVLDEEDYHEFIEACVDVKIYYQADEEIQAMVDFFYDDKRIAL